MRAPPRSFSQLATSFVAGLRLGIPRVLFPAWPVLEISFENRPTRAHTSQRSISQLPSTLIVKQRIGAVGAERMNVIRHPRMVNPLRPSLGVRPGRWRKRRPRLIVRPMVSPSNTRAGPGSGRAIVTQRGAERWRRGHPWIYRSDVAQAPEGPAGVVRVESDHGRLIGMALWSPPSQISLRMLTREARPIDGAFWRERLDAAVAYRERLAPDATAYRLVHAEADRYGGVLSVQLLSAGLEAQRGVILEALLDRLRPEGVVARNDVPVRSYEELPREVELLHGSVPERLEVREGSVRYLVDLLEGQKTGAFLDQRQNRLLAAACARGRALDCFSYHGSFGTGAGAGEGERGAEPAGRLRGDRGERLRVPASGGGFRRAL